MLGIIKSSREKTGERILSTLCAMTVSLTIGQTRWAGAHTPRDASPTDTDAPASQPTRGASKMADPSALNPSIIEKVLDPNNLVAVVTVGLLYMFYKFTSRRFDLEHQEQEQLAKRIDDLYEELLKLEGKVDLISERAKHD
jgi:hypothetical protein